LGNSVVGADLDRRALAVAAPMMNETILILVFRFFVLAFFAIGGANAIVPEMHRLAVEQMHWMTSADFASYYAIAQATPGPNMLIVTLIGWHAAGIGGALAATAAVCTPGCLLTYVIFRMWNRFKDRPWRAAVQEGLAPVVIGIICASAYLLVQTTDQGMATLAISATTGCVAYFTRWNPLIALAVAAALGGAGLA
jgi:chromate transporter